MRLIMGRLFNNVFVRRTSTRSELLFSFLKDSLSPPNLYGQVSFLLQNHFVIYPCSHTIYFLFQTRPARVTTKTAKGWFFSRTYSTNAINDLINKKLLSQFSFKTSQGGLEVFLFSSVILMKNLQQRETVAKLRSGNDD